MMEEALTAKKRNSLDNSKFALVYKDDKGKTIRKYPVHDKAHVQAASKMFPRGVPEKYQGKVARRILAEAREHKLDTSGWDNVNKAADKKKVVQEFEDPIKSLQEATSGSMNFMNHLMTINLLNSGSVQESLKQLSRNNLKPVMFMGFMNPDNVNRCEYKDLEKHVIYATDNGTLYASFFNSFSRTKEISEIALSLDSFINDLPNKKVSQEHIPTHMNDCMISLSDEGRTIHSRGNVPMKLEYEDAFFMNAYYSYFAVYEAFEFKENSLYKDISKVILSQLDGDESHFDFESVDVTQETFGSAKIHIRFRYDNDPYVVVIPTESMKTLPAKLYRESARDTDTEGSGEMNNTEETPIQEQEVDENGLIKVKNIPSDMMYFGSFKDFGNNMLKLSKPRLFVTPYMGIASIFTVDRSRYNIPPGESVNLAYDEWNSDDNEEPFEEIHTIVEGIPDFPERSFENTGWIYGIDISKYKDNIYQESWMNPEKEFLIIDVPELPIAKKIRHEMIVNVRGGELRKVPQKEVVQESIASALPGHRFDAMMDYMRKRVDLRNHFLLFKHQHGLNKSFLKRTQLQLENISDGREPFMLLGFLTVGDVRHTPIKDLDRHALYKASDGVYTKLLNTKGELEKVAETGTEFIDSFESVRVPVANIPERMRTCDVYMYRDDVLRAMLYGMVGLPVFAFINTYLFQSNVPIEFIHKSDTVSMHTYYAYFAAYETMGYCLAGLGRKIWILIAKIWGEFSQPSFRKITIKEESDTKTSVVASIISRDRGFDLKFTIENFVSVNCELLNEDGTKVKSIHKYTKPITIRESEGMDPEDYEDIHDHIDDEDDIYNESGDMETIKGYRYTDGRDGEGIYEALKSEMYQKNGLTPAPWREFLDSDACKWLPKPPKYDDNNESWFTEEGNEKFKELTLPIVKEYIKNVKMETKNLPTEQIVYSDDYQFIINKDIRVQEGIGINLADPDYVPSGKSKEELEEELSKYIKTVEPDTVQEAFFGIGFGNLRKTIADKLGSYCTVTNVQNPTGKEEKFVVKSNENPEDFVNVISTGTGVKAYGYKHGERFSIFNNATLSAAAQRLIDAICDEFNIKLSVQEAFSMFLDDEVSPRQ